MLDIDAGRPKTAAPASCGSEAETWRLASGGKARGRYRRHLHRCRAGSRRTALQRQDPDDARGARARRARGDRRGAGRGRAGPGDLSIIIHGTTLATNAIIERKGAKTALVTTEGFRDTIEIRHENRFEQYDVNIDLPPPLVPRRLRFVVPERIDARGRVVVPLDEAAVEASRRAARGRSASRASRSAFCTASPTRRTKSAPATSCRAPCPA